MDRIVDLFTGTERGDDDRHLVADHLGEVLLEAIVRSVDDEVDRERSGRLLRIRRSVGGVRLGDLIEPVGQLRGRTGIERREGPNDSGLALSLDQFGPRGDEHGGADDGQTELGAQIGEACHGASLRR